MKVHRFSQPQSFLARAEPFLVRAEVENSLMLSLGSSGQIVSEDCYLATVDHGGEVVACATRTPPFKAVISRANQAALEPLVADLSAKYPRLPAVFGPEPTIDQFAALWAARVGVPVRQA